MNPAVAVAVSSAVAVLIASGARGDGDPPVQGNPSVSDSRHDTSPPLRDIPPAERKPGFVIHEVKPIPRPHRKAAQKPKRSKTPR